MKPITLTLVEKTHIVSAMWQLTFTTGEPATCRPGQFFLARTGLQFEAYLQRPLFLTAVGGEGPAGRFRLTVSARHLTDRGLAWLFSCPPGQRIDAVGPLGNGFLFPPAAKNWLVLLDEQMVEGLFLLDGLFATRNIGAVTLSFDLPHPLPPEIIRRIPSHVEITPTLTDDRLLWPDAIIALGGIPFYKKLKSRLAAARLRLSPGLAHVLLADAPLHICGVGACGLCAVPTTNGPRLACQAGPVFDLAELDLEAWPYD